MRFVLIFGKLDFGDLSDPDLRRRRHALRLEFFNSVFSTIFIHLSLRWLSNASSDFFVSSLLPDCLKEIYRVPHSWFQPGMYSFLNPCDMVFFAELIKSLLANIIFSTWRDTIYTINYNFSKWSPISFSKILSWFRNGLNCFDLISHIYDY